MNPRQKIVADTSAVLAVCLREETRRDIISQTKGVDLTAPESLPVEISNTLSSKFKQGALELHEALEGIQRFEAIPV